MDFWTPQYIIVLDRKKKKNILNFETIALCDQ